MFSRTTKKSALIMHHSLNCLLGNIKLPKKARHSFNNYWSRKAFHAECLATVKL